VDVTDKAAMRAHADEVAATGGIDIAFNATSNDDLQGIPLLDMEFSDFARPVSKAIAAHFTIATVTARHMTSGGVILAMGGGREAIPNLGGSHVAWSALAGLCRQLASELGSRGIRVAWLLSPGSPDPGSPDPGSPDLGDPDPGDPPAATMLLGRRPSYTDVANAAVFAASDWAATMTATEINLTGGAVID
jgi:3-oxoacyl-[acyl-carrier protein] reductase